MKPRSIVVMMLGTLLLSLGLDLALQPDVPSVSRPSPKLAAPETLLTSNSLTDVNEGDFIKLRPGAYYYVVVVNGRYEFMRRDIAPGEPGF